MLRSGKHLTPQLRETKKNKGLYMDSLEILGIIDRIQLMIYLDLSKCGPQIYTFRKLEGPFKGGDKECTAIQLGKCLIIVSVDKMLNNCFIFKQYYQLGISNTLL